MPRFRVKSPDGRTFVVDAPEGASQADVLSRVQAHAQASPKPEKSLWNTVQGLSGNLLNGVLPGLSGGGASRMPL